MTSPDPTTQNEIRRRQRMRNYAVFGALLLFVALVYITTMVKIKMVGTP